MSTSDGLDHSSRVLLLDRRACGNTVGSPGATGRARAIVVGAVQDRLPPMNADSASTTDGRYYPAVGAMHPARGLRRYRAMELVLQPDLRAAQRLPGGRGGPRLHDLDRPERRRQTRLPSGRSRRRGFHLVEGVLLRASSQWRRIERGLRPRDVLKVLGQPQHIVTRHDLGSRSRPGSMACDSYALVFVDGRVFDLASTRIVGPRSGSSWPSGAHVYSPRNNGAHPRLFTERGASTVFASRPSQRTATLRQRALLAPGGSPRLARPRRSARTSVTTAERRSTATTSNAS